MSYDLRLERLIDAAPHEVFDAFTDAQAHVIWYQDNPGWNVESSVDLRVDGVWSTSFGAAGETPYREVNTFSVVERPSRLEYRSTFHNADGTSFDTDLVVTFEARGDKTLLTIVQSGFEKREDRDDHQGGWPGFLDRLDVYITSSR